MLMRLRIAATNMTYRPGFYRLRLDVIRDWFLQIWFCHHNARVIADFEKRMSMVIYDATGGAMSKPYYTLEAMQGEINAFIERERDEAYAEGRKDALEEHGVAEPEK